MSLVNIIFQQNNDGYNVPGSRDDLALGSPITAFNQNNSGVIQWFWQFVSIPFGSTATIDSPTNSIIHFTPDIFGTYIVSLTINGGTMKNSAGASVKTQFLKLRLPAAQETLQFDGLYGWARSIDADLQSIDTNIGALNLSVAPRLNITNSGKLLQSPIIDLTPIRTATTYSFGNGLVSFDEYGRNIAATSATNLVLTTDLRLPPTPSAQGNIVFDTGTSYIQLSPGTAGQALITNGTNANPSWKNIVNSVASGGGLVVSGPTGNVTFSLPNVLSPSGTYQGITFDAYGRATSAISVGAVYADIYPGDWGSKISQAIASLPSTGGIINALGLIGIHNISATITIDRPVTILVGAAQITSSVTPAFNITAAINKAANFSLAGIDTYSSTIKSAANGILFNVSGDFFDYVGDGRAQIKISNMALFGGTGTSQAFVAASYPTTNFQDGEILITDSLISGFGSTSGAISIGASVYHVRLFRNYFENNAQALFINNNAESTVSENWFIQGAGGNASFIYVGPMCLCSHNYFYRNGITDTSNAPDILLQPQSAYPSQSGGYIWIEDNRFGGERENFDIARYRIRLLSDAGADPSHLVLAGPIKILNNNFIGGSAGATINYTAGNSTATVTLSANHTTSTLAGRSIVIANGPNGLNGTFSIASVTDSLNFVITLPASMGSNLSGACTVFANDIAAISLENPHQAVDLRGNYFLGYGYHVNDAQPDNASVVWAINSVYKDNFAAQTSLLGYKIFKNGGKAFAEIRPPLDSSQVEVTQQPRQIETRYLQNRALSTEQLNLWTAGNGTVYTGGQTDPYGTFRAALLTLSNTTPSSQYFRHIIDATSLPASGRVYVKFWAKAGASSTVGVGLYDATAAAWKGNYQKINLTSDWKEYKFLTNPLTAGDTYYMYFYPGDSTLISGSVYIFAPQVSDIDCDYIPNSSTTVMLQNNYFGARFDQGVIFSGNVSFNGTPNATTIDVSQPPYGADSTGVVDATSAVNSAITAANTSGAAIVYLPAGTYTFNATINMKSGVRLRGAGGGTRTLLKFTGSTGPFISFSSCNTCGIEDLELRYTNSGLTTALVTTANSSALYFTGVTFRGLNVGNLTTAASLLDLTNCIEARIHRCQFWGAQIGIQGINVTGFSNANKVNECVFNYCEIAAIQNPELDWHIDNCVFEPTTTGKASGIISSGAAYVAEGLAVTGCYFSDASVAGNNWIDLYAQGCSFTGNYINNCNGTSGFPLTLVSSIVFETGSRGVSFKGNHVIGAENITVPAAPNIGSWTQASSAVEIDFSGNWLINSTTGAAQTPPQSQTGSTQNVFLINAADANINSLVVTGTETVDSTLTTAGRLAISGWYQTHRAQVADTNYTVNNNNQTGDFGIVYTSLTAPRTVTVNPTGASVTAAREIYIDDTSGNASNTNTISVVSTTGTINGVTQGTPVVAISTPYGSARLRFDGYNTQLIKNPAQWVNVKDFGAKGDGVTNDTAAIQKAVDSIRDIGGTVFFPAGTYGIRNPGIQIIATSQHTYNNITLLGDGYGSCIKFLETIGLNNGTGNLAGIWFQGLNDFSMYNCGIDNLRVSGFDRSTLAGPLILFNRTTNGFVVNSWIDTNSTEGIYWNSPTSDANGVCINNRAQYIGGYGVSPPAGPLSAYNINTNNGLVSQCFADSCALAIEAVGSGIVITNNQFSNIAQGAALTPSTAMSLESTFPGTRYLIEGNLIKNCGLAIGFSSISSTQGDHLITGNIFENINTALSCVNDITVIFSNNNIYDTCSSGTGSSAIIDHSSSATAPLIISNNTVIAGPTGTWAYGILIRQPGNFDLVQNNVIDLSDGYNGFNAGIFTALVGSGLNTEFINNKLIRGNLGNTFPVYSWDGYALAKNNFAGVDHGTILSTLRPSNIRAANAPTTGAWSVGDIVVNSAPTATGIIQWICTTAGTPGTWTPQYLMPAPSANGNIIVDNGNAFLSQSQQNYDVRNYASFAAAITAIGATPATLAISNTQVVSTNVVVPVTLTLAFNGAGMLNINTGQTVTINGPLSAPLQQIFTGAGSVIFSGTTGTSSSAISPVRVYPQWWGALADGYHDDAAAINAATNSIRGTSVGNGGIVQFERGTYGIKTWVGCLQVSSNNLDGNNITWRGAGRDVSRIQALNVIGNIDGSFPGAMVIFQGWSAYSLKNITITGLGFFQYDDHTEPNGRLFLSTNVDGMTFTDNHLENCPVEGAILGVNPNNDRNYLISRNYATHIGGWGHTPGPSWSGPLSAYNVTATGVKLVDNDAYQVGMATEIYGPQIQIIGNRFYDCSTGATPTYQRAISVTGALPDGLIANNTIVLSGLAIALSVPTGTNNVTISNNVLRQVNSGIYVKNDGPVYVIDNQITDVAPEGYGSTNAIDHQVGSSGPMIARNNVISLGQTGTWANAIALDDASQWDIVEGNIIIGDCANNWPFRGTSSGAYNARFAHNTIIPLTMASTRPRYQWQGQLLRQSNIAGIDNGDTVIATVVPSKLFGTAAPTVGTWNVGDKLYNTAPTATGIDHWNCTTAGTPGTWTPQYGTTQAGSGISVLGNTISTIGVLNGIINVKDAAYGAKGDGVTDDTTAIQNAINAAGSNGSVFVPPGNYKISSTLTWTDLVGAKFFGAGTGSTSFTWAGIANGTMFSIIGCSLCEWESFHMVASNTPTAINYNGDVTNSIHSTECSFRMIWIDGGANGFAYGFRIGQQPGFQCDQSTYYRCRIQGCTQAAVSIEDANAVIHDFYSCHFTNNPGWGITAILQGTGGSFNAYSCGFNTNGTGSSTAWDLGVYNSSRGTVLSGCWAEGSSRFLKTGGGQTQACVSLIECSVNGLLDATGVGINLGGTGGCNIIGGRYKGTYSGPSIQFLITATSVNSTRRNLFVSGVTFSDGGDPFSDTSLRYLTVILNGIQYNSVMNTSQPAQTFGMLPRGTPISPFDATTGALSMYWAGAAWLKIPSGTILSPGSNSWTVTSFNCQGNASCDIDAIKSWGGLPGGQNLTAVDAGSQSMTVILNVPAPFTLTSDLVFKVSVHPEPSEVN